MNEHSLHTVLSSSSVQRFHTERVLYRQSVGEHCWRAVTLLYYLYQPEMPPTELVYAVQFHDAPEYATGDVRGDAKWADHSLSAALKKLEDDFYRRHGFNSVMLLDEEYRMIKVVDSLDLAMYCIDECELGNRKMAGVAIKVLDRLNTAGIDRTVPKNHLPRLLSLINSLYDRARSCDDDGK